MLANFDRFVRNLLLDPVMWA